MTQDIVFLYLTSYNMNTIMIFGSANYGIKVLQTKVPENLQKGREMKETIQIAGRIKHSSVNGPGVRYVLFLQGCPHRCPDCQNPETWDPEKGETILIRDIIKEIKETRYLDGLTLSGGDPFLQPEEAAAVAEAFREEGKDVWCYTGYTWEELLEQKKVPNAKRLLETIDILVDGKFQRDEADPELLYRGSRNQRLINVKLSLIDHNPKIYQEG